MKSFAALFAIVLAFVGIQAAGADSPAPQLDVVSCEVVSGGLAVPVSDELGLTVRFTNTSSDALRSIVWRAKYGEQLVDFIDDGTFSPNVPIDNQVLFARGSTHVDMGGAAMNVLGLFAHQTPSHSMAASNIQFPFYVSDEDPDNCAVVRATWANGQTWMNPQLEQFIPPIPTPTPRTSASPDVVPVVADAPLGIVHCAPQIDGRAQLAVGYEILGTQPADTVTIRTAIGDGAIDFVDHGSFAPGAMIQHNVRADVPGGTAGLLFYGMDDVSQCEAVAVHFKDGTSWQNPIVTGTPAPLATPVADALTYRMGRGWSERHAMPTPFPTAVPSGVPSAAPSATP